MSNYSRTVSHKMKQFGLFSNKEKEMNTLICHEISKARADIKAHPHDDALLNEHAKNLSQLAIKIRTQGMRRAYHLFVRAIDEVGLANHLGRSASSDQVWSAENFSQEKNIARILRREWQQNINNISRIKDI